MKKMYWLTRRVHPTWHFTSMLVGFIVGAASVLYFGWFESIWWLISAGIMFMFAVWQKRVFLVVMAFLSGFIGGQVRGNFEQHDLSIYDGLYGKNITLSGELSEDTEMGRGSEKIIRLSNVHFRDKGLPGKLWVTASTDTRLRRADQVTIQGKLNVGFGTFAGSIYRAKLIEASRSGGNIILDLRDDFAKSIHSSIDDPEASLGIGFLLGQKSDLPNDFEESLKIAGLTHIVVASGYNLTVLVRLARRLFEKVSKYLTAVASASLIIGFVNITGMSPSVTRASLVASLSL